MTVNQLRVLLARLPAECQHYPVAYHTSDGDVEAAVVLLCPPDPGDIVFPEGVIIIDRYTGTPDPASGIRLYRPHRVG